jgi:hypothetical protein
VIAVAIYATNPPFLRTVVMSKHSLVSCFSLDKDFRFPIRLSETQYKCSQGDPFEKVGGGGTVGVFRGF